MARPMDVDKFAKIVIIGESNVGKSSIIYRLHNEAAPGSYDTTIGAAFSQKTFDVDGLKVRLDIWDTAGQERFRSLTPSYLQDARAVIVTFDVSSKRSFEQLGAWLDLVETSQSERSYVVLAANKIDLEAWEVSEREIQQFDAPLVAAKFLVSAKTGQGVVELFQHIAQHLSTHAPARPRVHEASFEDEEPADGSCC